MFDRQSQFRRTVVDGEANLRRKLGCETGHCQQLQGNHFVQRGLRAVRANDNFFQTVVILVVDKLVQSDQPGQTFRFFRGGTSAATSDVEFAARWRSTSVREELLGIDRNWCAVFVDHYVDRTATVHSSTHSTEPTERRVALEAHG